MDLEPVLAGLKAELLKGQFELPAVFDISAVFFFALTGALAAMRRGYDIVGLVALGFVTGLGGALIRDGIFLQAGPPALTRDWRYLGVVIAGCLVGWVLGHFIERFRRVIALFDAVGLGAYSVVGAQKSLLAGLSLPAAVLVGVINACGGGLLRDIIVRDEPLVMKPGQFYVLASFFGAVVFVAGTKYLGLAAPVAALAAIGATLVMRVLAIAFNWRTVAMQPLLAASPERAAASTEDRR